MNESTKLTLEFTGIGHEVPKPKHKNELLLLHYQGEFFTRRTIVKEGNLVFDLPMWYAGTEYHVLDLTRKSLLTDFKVGDKVMVNCDGLHKGVVSSLDGIHDGWIGVTTDSFGGNFYPEFLTKLI